MLILTRVILRNIRLRNAGYVSTPAEKHPDVRAYLLKTGRQTTISKRMQTAVISPGYSDNAYDELVSPVAVPVCSDQYFAANCNEMFIMSPFLCKN
ncbi:hypothetical protein UA45_05615 [Morganella morganii]|uniref:Uncharacterized protein n=1 Tax=Morganella morganii TaxID=582 RepID=A0A0D8L9Q1_MORMO|nr:hypothetical protein UA45_05615 [Morganella morganii]